MSDHYEMQIGDLKEQIEEMKKDNDKLRWAIFDHLGTVEKSGYDINHFCSAMVKLHNEYNEKNK